MIPCGQTGEIANIKTMVDDLQHIVKGNGQPGMQTTLAQILTSQDQMICTMRDLTTNVRALVKFQIEVETEKKVNETKFEIQKWLVGIIIVLFTTVITLIIKK